MSNAIDTTAQTTSPILTVKRGAFQKIRAYVEECDAEISGFGKVRTVNGRDGIRFEIFDVEILPQTVGMADANMDEETIAAWMTAKIKKREKMEEWRVWWHSHHKMAAFFSGTDDKTIDQATEFPYLISLVTNQAGDVKARLDLHKPVRITIDLNVELEQPENRRLREQVRAEIGEKVKIKTFASYFHDPKTVDNIRPMGFHYEPDDRSSFQRFDETDDEYWDRLMKRKGLDVGMI